MTESKILFLGAGKMGAVIIKNLLADDVRPSSFLIIKPHKNNLIAKIKYISSYQELPKNYQADFVFFAFKPQQAKTALADFATHKPYHQNTIFISILAGKRIIFFEDFLGKKAKIIRLMPNLLITINEGIFSYFANFKISNQIKYWLDKLGKNIRLEKEELIDAATAIAGSGPAYWFLLVKIMINSAQKLGLSKIVAQKLVKQTIYGSAILMLNSNKSEDQLIKEVASKGGVTEAALEILNQDKDLERIIDRAIKSAYKRAKIIAKDD